ncbi:MULTISPECIES: hypothetical protein [Streptomyces]|uniref:Uncharacterized protein n=1 Tax=Streptomyces qinglanensis TaxID=943816 RepID=A0A1E7K6K8_9ACTN|nr:MULTISPECIES: hypothetical protein [Streptomyces]MBE9500170.1 hypothetical protein [Streptomyces sp. GKU 257-1]OEU99562.1 hypothetical protein AN217_19035 [Streptomyces qinglanensis]OEV23637.1 hypothetical protein AN220_23700 [Streptomyces nanshensis]
MGGHDDEKLVDSPLYADLARLRQSVAGQQDHIAATLDRAASDMGGGGVWEGPVAKTFASEVEGRKGEVHRLAQEIVDAVDAVLSRTPEQVPLSQAQLYRRAV